MYIRLNYSANTNWRNVSRLIAAMINDGTVVDTASAQTAAGSWDASMSANMDWDNVDIVRGSGSAAALNVKASIGHVTTSTSSSYVNRTSFNLEYQVYDDPTTKYYISTLTPGEYETHWRVGDSSSITMQDGLPPTNTSTTSRYTHYVGTSGVDGTNWWANSTSATYPTDLFDDVSWANITGVVAYVTDTCFIIAFTHQQVTPTSYGTTYTNNQYYTGPFIFSQYTRYDYWNTPANGIVPMAFTNFGYTGQGFKYQDFNRHNIYEGGNPTGGNVDYCAFRAFNFYNVTPRVGTSYPEIKFQRVNWGSGALFNDCAALDDGNYATTSASYPHNASIGRLVHVSPYYRYPSADLKDLGYAMWPMQIRGSAFGFGGGNMTDQSGFYLFNGDYQPGDEFSYNSKTYALVPTWNGYSERTALAIPKE